jgi:hypothetical protein
MAFVFVAVFILRWLHPDNIVPGPQPDPSARPEDVHISWPALFITVSWFGFLFFLRRSLPRWATRKRYIAAQQYTFGLGLEGISVSTSVSSLTIKWAAIARWGETRQLVYLAMADGTFFGIPRRLFMPDQLAWLRTTLDYFVTSRVFPPPANQFAAQSP